MPISSETVETPDFTDIVNQKFFIEPQGGPQHPISYLDSFPSAVYNKSINSNLVALMYALLGPSGLGDLRKNFLLARLAIEDAGLSTTNLDQFYGNPLGFIRLATETYEENPEGLLTTEQWQRIKAADESYRNRAIDYLHAVRSGGTLQGITLAAKSGLAHPVEVIENYKALYDEHSDNPLGLKVMGVTRSTEEVIVLPRQEIPQSEVQELKCTEAFEGKFALTIPIGPGTEEKEAKGGEPNKTTTNEFTIPFIDKFGKKDYTVWAIEIQTALEEVPSIGKGNVRVTGGPFNESPVFIEFTGALAERSLPAIEVVKNTLKNVGGGAVIPTVSINMVGVSAEEQVASIPPENWHAALLAIDNIKPMTTIPTPGKSPNITNRQVPNLIFSDSEFTEVIRYVTGKRNLPWPEVDLTHWIVAGIEKEAPIPQHEQQSSYLNFHNIAEVSAYTDAALSSPSYLTSEWPTAKTKFQDEHDSEYPYAQASRFPFLYSYANKPLEASGAVALPTELLTVRSTSNGLGLVNGIYPTDYSAVPGVEFIPSAPTIWGSLERKEGTDYLEIDLGTVQAVNFITFEISKKPCAISIAYDALDQYPERQFVPAVVRNEQGHATTLSVIYNTLAATNPWQTIVAPVSNSLGKMIYTRFIRIGFERMTGKEPFVTASGELIPYSFEVQHLRVGRNIP